MKRVLALLLAVFLVTALSACDSSTANKPNTDLIDDSPDNTTTHTHKYNSSVTKEANCTEDGVMTFSCVCGDTYTESISATHIWNEANCATAKTCSRCGQIDGDALGHNMENGVCSRCGFKVTVVLYEDSSVKITFKKAEKYSYGNDRAELYFYVENKTDETLLIQADAVSLNGYSFCNLVMSDNVTAHSIGTVNLSVQDFDFDLVKLNTINSIGGQFRIINDSTRKSYKAVFTNIKLDGTGIGDKPSDFDGKNLLYSDDKCAIYFKSIEKYSYSDDRAEVYLFVENKTDGTLLIQADAISLNGFGYSSLVMSDNVLSNTIGTVNLSVQDFDFTDVDINNLTKLGGQLRIINDATRKSYKATFTDIILS